MKKFLVSLLVSVVLAATLAVGAPAQKHTKAGGAQGGAASGGVSTTAKGTKATGGQHGKTVRTAARHHGKRKHRKAKKHASTGMKMGGMKKSEGAPKPYKK